MDGSAADEDRPTRQASDRGGKQQTGEGEPDVGTGADPDARPPAVVAVFADGSEKYTKMTVTALRTLLQATPNVDAGLLVHNTGVAAAVMALIPRRWHSRVRVQLTSQTPPLGMPWNPTQYKLDIARFLDQDPSLKAVFWLDSDCVVVGNIHTAISSFLCGAEKMFLVADHVMHNPEFLARWARTQPVDFIPQACFMGFKREVVAELFAAWRYYWRKWISPTPFAQLPDPAPNFAGSAFCTEQYALGMAIGTLARRANVYAGGGAPPVFVRTFERGVAVLQEAGDTPAFDLEEDVDDEDSQQDSQHDEETPSNSGAPAGTTGSASSEAANDVLPILNERETIPTATKAEGVRAGARQAEAIPRPAPRLELTNNWASDGVDLDVANAMVAASASTDAQRFARRPSLPRRTDKVVPVDSQAYQEDSSETDAFSSLPIALTRSPGTTSLSVVEQPPRQPETSVPLVPAISKPPPAAPATVSFLVSPGTNAALSSYGGSWTTVAFISSPLSLAVGARTSDTSVHAFLPASLSLSGSLHASAGWATNAPASIQPPARLARHAEAALLVATATGALTALPYTPDGVAEAVQARGEGVVVDRFLDGNLLHLYGVQYARAVHHLESMGVLGAANNDK